MFDGGTSAPGLAAAEPWGSAGSGGDSNPVAFAVGSGGSFDDGGRDGSLDDGGSEGSDADDSAAVGGGGAAMMSVGG